jgi:hypothetical protein
MADRISDDEAAILAAAVQRREAQLAAANAPLESLLDYLGRKYGLRPGVDRVHPDGRIERPADGRDGPAPGGRPEA